MILTCPHCGSAIDVQILVQPGAKEVQSDVQLVMQNGANSGAIAQEILRSKVYNQGYDQDFLTFWGAYPRKRAKGVAYKSWSKAVQRLCANTGANAQGAKGAILQGAIAYRDDPNRQDEYTQHAATWLNGDGWEDEPLPLRLGGKEPAPKTVTEDDYRRITSD